MGDEADTVDLDDERVGEPAELSLCVATLRIVLGEHDAAGVQIGVDLGAEGAARDELAIGCECLEREREVVWLNCM